MYIWHYYVFEHLRLTLCKTFKTSMVERFFSVRQMELLNHNNSDPIMLLSGPPSWYVRNCYSSGFELRIYDNLWICSGKTSLLFQFAFNSAVGSNHKVVFICSKRKLESKPPFLSQVCILLSHTFPSYYISKTLFVPYILLVKVTRRTLFLPLKFQGIDPSSDTFQRIQMKYVSPYESKRRTMMIMLLKPW